MRPELKDQAWIAPRTSAERGYWLDVVAADPELALWHPTSDDSLDVSSRSVYYPANYTGIAPLWNGGSGRSLWDIAGGSNSFQRVGNSIKPYLSLYQMRLDINAAQFRLQYPNERFRLMFLLLKLPRNFVWSEETGPDANYFPIQTSGPIMMEDVFEDPEHWWQSSYTSFIRGTRKQDFKVVKRVYYTFMPKRDAVGFPPPLWADADGTGVAPYNNNTETPGAEGDAVGMTQVLPAHVERPGLSGGRPLLAPAVSTPGLVGGVPRVFGQARVVKDIKLTFKPKNETMWFASDVGSGALGGVPAPQNTNTYNANNDHLEHYYVWCVLASHDIRRTSSDTAGTSRIEPVAIEVREWREFYTDP